MKVIPEFQKIDPLKWERQAYFDYYYNTIKTKYTLNANIDITELLELKDQKELKFFPVFMYVIMRIVNRNKEFRMSFDKEGKLGYWNFLYPSYTIFHNDDKTFSDIWSDYHEDFRTFYNCIVADMEKYKNVKGIKAREGRPANYCHISSLPWLSFTAYSHDSYSESELLFPLVRFGKYFKQENKTFVPLAVFVNHAVADGYHTSMLINQVQEFSFNAASWME